MFLYSMEIQFVQINSQVDLMLLYCSVDDSFEKVCQTGLESYRLSYYREAHGYRIQLHVKQTHSDTDIK